MKKRRLSVVDSDSVKWGRCVYTAEPTTISSSVPGSDEHVWVSSRYVKRLKRETSLARRLVTHRNRPNFPSNLSRQEKALRFTRTVLNAKIVYHQRVKEVTRKRSSLWLMIAHFSRTNEVQLVFTYTTDGDQFTVFTKRPPENHFLNASIKSACARYGLAMQKVVRKLRMGDV